jgi:hypothetical protein
MTYGSVISPAVGAFQSEELQAPRSEPFAVSRMPHAAAGRPYDSQSSLKQLATHPRGIY